MRAAKVQASLRIRAVSPEPPLLAHTSNESRGTFRQEARSLASLNGWACAVEICHDGMLEDTNSLDGAQLTHTVKTLTLFKKILKECQNQTIFKFYNRTISFGPRQANLCLRAFRHDKFQLRMPRHSEEPGIWLSV